MLRSLILSIAVLTTAPAPGQDLDQRVQTWQQTQGILGIAVAVQTATALDISVAGLLEADGQHVATGDRFSSASVSKTFTAAAILALVSRGELSLQDRVSEVSGLDFGEELTVENLLYHEAGIAEFIGGSLSFETFLSEHGQGRTAWSTQEVVAFATASPGQAGSDFAYSNAHYVILGRIIEQATGMPVEQALQALVFAPAGLESARLIHEAGESPDAHGHSDMLAGALGRAQLDARLSTELASLASSAGGVMLNAGDLAKWTRLWFSGEFMAGQSFRDPRGGQALGLPAGQIQVGAGGFSVRYDLGTMLLHGGDGLGVTALALYDPESGIAVAILMNDDSVRSLGFGADGFADAFALELIESYRASPD